MDDFPTDEQMFTSFIQTVDKATSETVQTLNQSTPISNVSVSPNQPVQTPTPSTSRNDAAPVSTPKNSKKKTTATNKTAMTKKKR